MFKRWMCVVALLFALSLLTVAAVGYAAMENGLSVPVAYAIRNDDTGRVLTGHYTIVVTRVGSRYSRIVAKGRTDANGTIRTRVAVPCPPAISKVLTPFLQ